MKRNDRRRPVYNKSLQQTKADTAENHPCISCRQIAMEISNLKDALRIHSKEKDGGVERIEANDDRRYALDVKTFRAMVVYTTLTLGLFILGFCQLREAHVQTVASRRAWLAPEHFTMIISESGDFVSIHGDTSNVGKEPATHVLFAKEDGGFLPIYSQDARTFNIPNDNMCAGSTDWKAKGADTELDHTFWSTIFPGIPLDFIRGLKVLPKDDSEENKFVAQYNRDELKAFRGIYYFRDCVSYFTLGEHHTTAFCYFLINDLIKGKMETYPCGENNSAD